ncbi:MAG TPA: hypothetical protein VL991_09030 [Terracidiphilus sp.]|nr:hypothetical protein [Terracidiphilus sp.]
MDEPESLESREELGPKTVDAPRPRAVGSPLPKGDTGRAPAPLFQANAARITPVDDAIGEEVPLEALEDPEQPSNLQRAVKGVRMALPFVQKVLPLLDGQVIATVANLLAPRPPAPAPPVNLAPLETGLLELQTQQRKLREQVIEQNALLKKVEDRLEMVREATDRNTLEQQELLDDLKSVRRKMTVFAVFVLLLLAGLGGLNVVMFLYMRGFLR